jgi:hypothetical protein
VGRRWAASGRGRGIVAGRSTSSLATMEERTEHNGVTKERIFVLFVGAFLGLLAGLAYIWVWHEYWWAVGILGGLSAPFFLVFFFGSDRTCENLLTYVFGWAPWWPF